MKAAAVLGGIVIVGSVAAVLGSSPTAVPSKGGKKMPALPQRNMHTLRTVMDGSGLPSVWRDFLTFVAAGESGGNNLVGLGDPLRMPPQTKTHTDWLARVAEAHRDGKPAPSLSKLQNAEANAAAVAYSRNDWLRGYWDAKWYTFGSGGWFGILPANGLAVFRNVLLPDGRRLNGQHPWLVFDPGCSVLMALGMIRRLQGWNAWRDGPRTAGMLRVGWVMPSRMNDVDWFEANRRERYERHARSVGLGSAFVDRSMPQLSSVNVLDLMERLRAAVWLPQTTVA